MESNAEVTSGKSPLQDSGPHLYKKSDGKGYFRNLPELIICDATY